MIYVDQFKPKIINLLPKNTTYVVFTQISLDVLYSILINQDLVQESNPAFPDNKLFPPPTKIQT